MERSNQSIITPEHKVAREEKPLLCPAPVSSLSDTAAGGSAVFVASGFGNGLNYLFSMFLARALGPIEFGLYAIGLTCFNVLTLIAPLGTNTGSIKFVSQFVARKDFSQLRGTIQAALTITIASSVLLASFLAIGATAISSNLYSKPELAPILVLFAISVPFAALTTVLIAILQAFQSIRHTILIKYVWEPVGKFSLVGLTLLLGLGLTGAVLAICLSIAIGTFIGVRALKKMPQMMFEGGNWPQKDQLSSFVFFCSPIAIANIFGVIAPRSDILVLGYWTTAQEIGVYLAALQTAGIITLVLGAFETAFAPLIARVLALGDALRLREAYQSLSRLVIVLTIPLCILINAISSELLGLYGKDFSSAWICLAILTIGHVISSGASSPNHILLMGGHSYTVMLNTITTSILQIGFMLLLVPLWGTTGAAIATSGGLLAITATRVAQVWKRYHVHPFSFRLLKPLISGMAMTGAILTTNLAIGNLPYGLTIPCLSVIGIGTYIGSLALLGVDPSDRLMIYNACTRVPLLKVIASWLIRPQRDGFPEPPIPPNSK